MREGIHRLGGARVHHKGRARRGVAAVAVMVATVLAMSLGHAAPGAASTTPTWTLQESYPAPVDGLNSVFCSTQLDCVAVGGSVIISTSDGGATWTADDVAGVSSLSAVTCTTAAHCIATGANSDFEGLILTTADGGTTWNLQTTPSDIRTVSGVSCPTASTCVAAASSFSSDGVVLVSSDGGATWSEASVPGSPNGFDGVSCSGSGTCVVIQDYEYDAVNNAVWISSDGGASWTASSVSGAFAIEGVSCPGETDCLVTAIPETGGNAAVYATGNGGQSWTRQDIPATVHGLFGVSCTATLDCWAVGGATTNDTAAVISAYDPWDAGEWTSQTPPSDVPQLYGVSCPSESACVSVDEASIAGTTDGGVSWTDQVAPTGVPELGTVSCASTSACMAVGDQSGEDEYLTTSDSGAAWSAPAPVSDSPYGDFFDADDLSCPTASSCTAVSGQSQPAITTDDTGASWADGQTPSDVELDGVDCASNTICSAVGNDEGGGQIIDSADGGSTWLDGASYDDFPPFTFDDGSYGVGYLYGISCPSTTTCFAVGAGGTDAGPGVVVTSSNDGVTWSTQVPSDDVQSFTGISCSSTTDCVAVGFIGDFSSPAVYTTTDGGTAWSAAASVPETGDELTTVSCTGPSFCVAIDSGDPSGNVVSSVDGGQTWVADTVPLDVAYLDDVSCAATGVCEAVGVDSDGGGVIIGLASPVSPPPTTSTTTTATTTPATSTTTLAAPTTTPAPTTTTTTPPTTTTTTTTPPTTTTTTTTTTAPTTTPPTPSTTSTAAATTTSTPTPTTTPPAPAPATLPTTPPATAPLKSSEDAGPRPTLSLGQEMSTPGGNMTVSGKGCRPGAAVLLAVDNQKIGSAVADSSGAFRASFQDLNLEVGQHTVAARCGATITTALQVVALISSAPGNSTLIILVILLVFILALTYRIVR